MNFPLIEAVCCGGGGGVVIPEMLQHHVLKACHISQLGIVQMKVLAQSYIWWPNMEDANMSWVESMPGIEAKGNTWENSKAPWSRIHIDLAGPFHGQTFMVAVDSYSKRLEVVLMSSTTLEGIIKILQELFVTHGLPDVLVFDNEPQFTLVQFERYLLGLGVHHMLTAPFHPASNGQAEQMA